MIYISSSCVKKNKIADIITLFAENGIQNIELSGGTDYYGELEEDLKQLKEKYRLQYACHAYFPPPEIPFVVNLASCNDRIYRQSIEHYENCIRMLKRLECSVLSIHAGFLIEIGVGEIGQKLNAATVYDESKAYDRFCSAYRHLEKLCMERHIAFFLENNVLSAENYLEFGRQNYMMMTDYKSIMKMKGQLEFDLLLDLGHLHVSAETLRLDYRKECDGLKEHAKWLHVSDNNGIFDEHKPLKKGSAILEQFYKMYHYGLNATLETAGEMEDILSGMRLLNRAGGD